MFQSRIDLSSLPVIMYSSIAGTKMMVFTGAECPRKSHSWT